MSLTDAPAHVWSAVALVGYLATLAVISAIGMALGYPQVLWVWLLPLLTGLETDDCRCDSCEPEEESARETIARRYASGDLSDAEMKELTERVERIEAADEDELERVLD